MRIQERFLFSALRGPGLLAIVSGPFSQAHDDRPGPMTGLVIARRNEAQGLGTTANSHKQSTARSAATFGRRLTSCCNVRMNFVPIRCC